MKTPSVVLYLCTVNFLRAGTLLYIGLSLVVSVTAFFDLLYNI